MIKKLLFAEYFIHAGAHLHFFSNSKDRKSVASDDYFGDEHYLAFFHPPEEKKRPSSGGKSQYHSDAKLIPDVKPIFDASEQVEQRESKKAPKKEELAEDDNGIR